jgi:hypothetical protein
MSAIAGIPGDANVSEVSFQLAAAGGPAVIGYRAVSGVFRTIDPPPLSTQLQCVLPPHQRRVYTTHSPGGEGVGGQYFGRRQTLLCTLYM